MFWRLTIRGLFREFVVAKRKREDEHNHRVTMAWQTAALTRGTKGLPKLESLLVGKRPTRKQSPQEQAVMWQAIAARFGGTFKPLDPKTRIIRG